MTIQRLVIRRESGLYEILEPDDVYYLEAREDDTLVRRRDAEPLFDMRSITDLASALEPFGFLRIHRSYAINLARVRQIQRRGRGRDWEVRMDPPVNRVLPVSRRSLPVLLAALGAPPDDV